ncbi:MAG: hypothetical protein JNL79_10215 [Myxococcales bacterium]|nr:hypothetical protein [Myxococcales bacterium]
MSSPRSLDPFSPFERVLHFGERHGVPIVVAALLSSTSVHYAFAYASTIVEVQFKDVAKVQCRSGENVQVELLARARFGGFADATGAAAWSTDNALVAQSAGGGLLRCLGQGDTVFRASYGGRTVVLPVHVDPAIMMVEEEKKEEPPPPPPPPPEEKPEPPPPSNTPPEQVQPNTTAAAKAGNLLTATDDAPKNSDDPVSFVTDPNGTEYGSGTVMKGGTADKSKGGPVSTAPPSGSGSVAGKPPPPPPPPQTGPDLSAVPSLPGGKSFCNGYFPNAEADDDAGFVQVIIDVDASGKVTKAVVVKETPKGQGFGKAARSCLLSPRKINPGLDASGKPVGKSLTINLNFTRG